MPADQSANVPGRNLHQSLRSRESFPSPVVTYQDFLASLEPPQNVSQGTTKKHAAPRQTGIPRNQQTRSTTVIPNSSPSHLFGRRLSKDDLHSFGMDQINQAQGDVGSTQEANPVSRAEHDRLKADLARVEIVIASFKSDRLADSFSITPEAQLRHIRKVFHAMDQELAAPKAEVDSLKIAATNRDQDSHGQAKASQSHIKRLQDELASVKAENVMLVQAQQDSKDRVSKDMPWLRDEIMSLEQDKYFLNEFCMAKQTEIKNLNDDFKAQWESWETQLETLQTANDSLQQTIDRQNEEAAEQNLEHQSIIDELKEEHTSLIEHQQQRHNECLDKIDDLEDERVALQEEAANLREENYALLKDTGDTISGLQQDVLALEDANATLEENLTQAQFALESLPLRAEELEQMVQHVEQEHNNQAEHWHSVLENSEVQNQRLLQELELAESLLNEAKDETAAAIEGGKKKEAVAACDHVGRGRSLALAFLLGIFMGFMALFGFYYFRDLQEI
ncbi:hypothetical protein AC578_3536 [Pseudocercospora eumusae]|uniref:Uncharacterized protein n=1 Tax=Pseudocercospora eumusae TaxID=321146 RepID=A0A139H9K4_9PEZI|nr:hypothetical protein AC578_3536 [Pseudocercospora eumusae]